MTLGWKLSSILIVLGVGSSCYGHPTFQKLIPNGNAVPHPCKANQVWAGVGHENWLGSGVRNAFGVAFKENSFVWDSTLCNKDSDGDGKTNGEELGDPDCTWTQNTAPKRTTGLSHPGICDPFDNPRCSGKPEFIDCDSPAFKCDALQQPDALNFTVRFSEAIVPDEETTYECILFDFPVLNGSVSEYHITAYTPVIDTTEIMHHMIIFGCTDEVTQKRGEQYRCNMRAHRNCNEIIGLWTVGMAGHCIPSETGFLVGGAQGYKTAALQVHWNNPGKRSDYRDSSGMNIHVTGKLRPNNAGVLSVGQQHLQLPPGKQRYLAEATCYGDCTQRVLRGEINVVSAINHMHYLGSSQITMSLRDGKQVGNIAIDQTYSYDFPIMYDHSPAIVVRPGDDIHTVCAFKTTSRTKTTFSGDSTSEEMCYSFLIYYPKENVNYQYCISWKGIGFCEMMDGESRDGCDFNKLGDISDPEVIGMYVNVTTFCDMNLCLEECKNYIRGLRRSSPCFSGDNFDYFKRGAMRTDEGADLMKRASSCDVELALEENEETSTAGLKAMASVASLIWMVLAMIFL